MGAGKSDAVLVLIPGIVGRREWLGPAVSALARVHRVITFSLDDVRGLSIFERWSRHIAELVAERGEGPAAIVGISFGALVAAHVAGTRPHAVSKLVLVSPPAPRWQIDPRLARLARHPRLLFPLFLARGARRFAPELRTALPTMRDKARFVAAHVPTALTAMPSPTRMAEWVRAWQDIDLEPATRAITAPTLVVAGEPDLDRIVPVSSSIEYLTLIRGATFVTLPGTGHLGFITRPHEFVSIVTDFVKADAADRRASA